jgi:1-acyl-sn-glycerol-3-phosphate acyltransferase
MSPEPGRARSADGRVVHLRPDLAESAVIGRSEGGGEDRVAAALALIRRRLTGDYHIDDFGFDAELTEAAVLPLARQLYRRWFRTELFGAAHVPLHGGALVVSNHAGGLWALDSVMTATAVHDATDGNRFLRMLGADIVFSVPLIANLARRSGAVLACRANTERLLDAGELVGVWPEGFKGIGKPVSERYKLQRFGRGQFVAMALRAGVPIVPTAVVGSEEIYPVLATVPAVATMLKLPYFPLTPTFPWLGPLGLVPLPSKWLIEFGEPIETAGYGPDAADDARLVFELTDRIREQIQTALYRLRGQRRSVWR